MHPHEQVPSPCCSPTSFSMSVTPYCSEAYLEVVIMSARTARHTLELSRKSLLSPPFAIRGSPPGSFGRLQCKQADRSVEDIRQQ